MKTFDWQSMAVAAIILGALLYVARRVFARLRSFVAAGRGGATSSCATGCGKCGDEERTTTTHPARVLVQLGRSKKA